MAEAITMIQARTNLKFPGVLHSQHSLFKTSNGFSSDFQVLLSGRLLLSMGVWYRLWWVWLERCRDGSYAVNALHCDVWVVCACIVVCTVACFIGFWGSVFWWKYIPTSLVFALFGKVLLTNIRRKLGE